MFLSNVKNLVCQTEGVKTMTGELRAKNGIWQMRFSWKENTGKWKRKEESTRLSTDGNKRIAKDLMLKRLSELEAEIKINAEEPKKADSPLLLVEMEQWLDDVVIHQIRQNTFHQYKYAFSGGIAKYELFQQLKLKDVTPKVLQGFVTYKLNQGLTPSTIKKHFVILHKFFDYLWYLEEIADNPADRVRLPKLDRNQKGEIYSPEELQKLIVLFKNDPLYLFILLAVNYGMRRSEICGLKWDAIDLKNAHLYVQATSVVDCGAVLHTDNTKSRSSKRQLPLSNIVLQALKYERLKQMQNKMKLGADYHNNDFVCCWDNGLPLRPDYVTNHYKSVIVENGFRFVSLRNLRDTAATMLHKSGFDVKSIQGFLGHADVSTTANIYVHFDNQDMSKMADTIGDAIKKKA